MSFFSQIKDRNHSFRIPFVRVGSATDRAHQRFDCYAIGTLSMINRDMWMDGVVDSISARGLQFRPASSFILDRRGEPVSVEIDDKRFAGLIVSVRESGYGIALEERVTTSNLAALVEEYGFQNAV